MTTLALLNPKTAMRALMKRMGADERGVAVIEFAMIMPIMFMLFIGSVEFSQAISVDRRVTQISSSMADLVAQEKTITTAQLNNLMEIAKVLMRPYSTTPLKISIVSVGAKSDNAAVTKVCWAYMFQGGTQAYAKGQTYTLAAGLVDKGGSTVVAEVRYDYTPLIFHYFITSTMALKDKFILKPRVSNMIQFNADAICTVT